MIRAWIDRGVSHGARGASSAKTGDSTRRVRRFAALRRSDAVAVAPRGLILLVITVLFAAQGPAVEAGGKDRLMLARAQFARAEVSLEKAEFERAERLFRKAIAIEPELPTAYLGLGKVLVSQQRYEEALDALEEAERRFVAWEQETHMADLVKRQLAERQMQSLKDTQAVLDDRGSGLGASARTPSGPSQLTPAKIETEQFVFREQREMEDFDAIPAQVFYLEGISYLRTRKRSEGIAALEICLLIDERYQLAHYNLAVARFTRGELDLAQTHLAAAIANGAEPDARFVADLERAIGARSVTAAKN